MNKYGARKVEVDGYKFDSAAEASYYGHLKLLESQGQIRALEVHPAWNLTVNGHKIGRYTADFAYINDRGECEVCDVKGVATEAYRLRKKLMQAIHGIKVIEIHRNIRKG